MSVHEALLERVRSSNPVPDPGRADQSELRAVFAVLEKRGVVMATTTHRTREAPVPRLSRRRRPGWVFAAAFLLMVTAVGVVAFLFRGEGAGPDRSVASISLAPDAWSQVSAEVTDPIVGISGIVDLGSTLIAVGWDPGDDYLQNGVAFRSADGLTWERSGEFDESLTLGGAFIMGASDFGDRIVAVGWSCEDGDAGCAPAATSWISPDGVAWTRSAPDEAAFGDGDLEVAWFNEVVATGNSVVAVGAVEYRQVDEDGMQTGATWHPAVWNSTDGLAWTRTFEGDGATVDMENYRGPTMAVAEAPNGRLVMVASMFSGEGQFIGTVFVSDDWLSWQRVPHDDAMFAGGGSDLMMWDVAASDAGFVAVGGENSSEPVVWTSPDGLTWTRHHSDESGIAFDGSLAAVAVGGDGYLAVGSPMYNEADKPITAWTSVDGVSWRRIFESENVGYATEIVMVDEGLVIGGATFRSNDFHAGLWVGPSGS